MAVHRGQRPGSASVGDVRDVLDAARPRRRQGAHRRRRLGAGAGRRTSAAPSRPRSPPRWRSTADIDDRPGQRQQRRADVGRQGEQQGAHARSIVFFFVDRGLPVVPLRVAHGRSPRSSRWSTTSSSPSASTRSPDSRSRPATVVAFLTILGFSLYDTVVVFDKVKDNQARARHRARRHLLDDGQPLAEPGADALDQHVVRRRCSRWRRCSFVGTYCSAASALRDFALALFVGLLTGAYSSIFVATPVLAWLKEREPRYRALRERRGRDLAKAGSSRRCAPVVAGEPVDARRRRGRPAGPDDRSRRRSPPTTCRRRARRPRPRRGRGDRAPAAPRAASSRRRRRRAPGSPRRPPSSRAISARLCRPSTAGGARGRRR